MNYFFEGEFKGLNMANSNYMRYIKPSYAAQH